jgi:flagellar biosynthetic protein FliQ
MDQAVLFDEAGRMLAVIALVCVVLLVPMTIVSLIIGIIQTATSINEQTLSFVPKLIALMVCLIVFSSMIAGLLIGFTTEIFAVIANIGHR